MPEILLTIAMFPDGLELASTGHTNHGLLPMLTAVRTIFFSGAETLLVAPMMVNVDPMPRSSRVQVPYDSRSKFISRFASNPQAIDMLSW
jgi:hypothetical protein